MTPEQIEAVALKMAKAIHRGFWSGDRANEKRQLTMARNFIRVMLSDPVGKEIASQQLELLDQP